jgi:hypothetical protein
MWLNILMPERAVTLSFEEIVDEKTIYGKQSRVI